MPVSVGLSGFVCPAVCMCAWLCVRMFVLFVHLVDCLSLYLQMIDLAGSEKELTSKPRDDDDFDRDPSSRSINGYKRGINLAGSVPTARPETSTEKVGRVG